MNDGGELTMLNDIKIKNTDELEFAVFCIENIAMSLKKWYRALTDSLQYFKQLCYTGV